MPVISGVTFDLWQTLIMDNRELGRARMQVRLDGALEALGNAGENFSEDQVRDAYRQCYRTCHDIRDEERDVTFREQVEIFIGHIDQGLMGRLDEAVVKQIADIYADSLFHFPPPAHPDAVEVLRKVKEKGYRTGLISNTGMTPGYTFRVYMEQIGILDYFDVLTFSDEVRLAKPSRAIFLQTANEMGVSPEQIAHVGDHLLNDVLGARNADMKTVWIETYDERRKAVEVKPDVTVPALADVAEAIYSLG